jgi:hypothetical protein
MLGDIGECAELAKGSVERGTGTTRDLAQRPEPFLLLPPTRNYWPIAMSFACPISTPIALSSIYDTG